MLKYVLLAGCVVLTTTAGAGIGLAQGSGPFGGFGYDKQVPLEITSNALEVRQSDNVAIFTGNVVAGQGTLHLATNKLNVHYRKRNNDTGNTSEAGSRRSAIERIDATGGVLLCNGSETAQGDTGTYDVAAGKISMKGNVVLTQGGHAIAGPILEIDLNTGVGRVIGTSGNPVRSLLTPAGANGANSRAVHCNG